MVIHTIIDEYDILYAQEREAAYALRAENTNDGGFATLLSASCTRLPEINDNGGNFYDIVRGHYPRTYTGLIGVSSDIKLGAFVGHSALFRNSR